MTLSKREFALQTYLDDKHGFPPHNPFKVIRHEKGLSLQQLATASGLSKNSIVRAENGTYTNPLGTLVDFWTRRGYPYNELLERYEDFQLSMRERANLYFGNSLVVKTDHGTNHPLRQLRTLRPSKVDGLPLPVGIEQVSRDLCLPVDTLRRFEFQHVRQKSVPRTLMITLSYIGYSGKQCAEFDLNYRLWRSNNLKVMVTNEQPQSVSG